MAGLMDELDARVRSLEAERLRPVPPAPGPATGIALAELCLALGDEESALALDDPEYRPLRQLVADQSHDVSGPDALTGGPLDGLSELDAGGFAGALGPAVGPAVADQIFTYVTHAVMMPRPDD